MQISVRRLSLKNWEVAATQVRIDDEERVGHMEYKRAKIILGNREEGVWSQGRVIY